MAFQLIHVTQLVAAHSHQLVVFFRQTIVTRIFHYLTLLSKQAFKCTELSRFRQTGYLNTKDSRWPL